MCSRLITFICVAFVLFGSGWTGDHSILKPCAALAQGVQVEELKPEVWGLSSHPRLSLDTKVEVPGQNDNAVTLPEKKAGDSIQFQLFAPHAGGTQIQGFTVELSLRGKTFRDYVDDVSGTDLNGNALLSRVSDTGNPTLSMLALSAVTVPSSGYLGKVTLGVSRSLTSSDVLAVPSASIAGEGGVRNLDVSDASVSFVQATACPGDFDGDGTVSLADFLAFAGAFGTRSEDANFNALTDLDGNGAVDLSDFLVFAGVFGTTCPTPPPGGADREALVALYNATDGDNWRFNTNWLSDRPLGEWFGVTTNVGGAVRGLSLDGNNLSGSLPPLRDLSDLRHLAIGWNSITSLSERPFAGMDMLLFLQLNDNEITTLPEDVFTDLVNLTQLILGPNDFTSIPNGLFDGLESLEVLSLNGNTNHMEFPERPFAQLASLRELNLQDLGISTLPDAFFVGLTNLEILDLRSNPGSPLSLAFEFERVDHTNPSAPGPATVRARIKSGAPYSIAASVSVTNGSSTASRLMINAGAAASQTFEVRQDAGTASSPTYLQAEVVNSVPPRFVGLGPLQMHHLALFADSDNQAPIARRAVPHLVLQVGGPRPTVDIRPYFSEPDGEELTYSMTVASLEEERAADVTLVEQSIALSPIRTGRDVWTITATDPRGLRASIDVGITVLPAPNDETFNIDLVFFENTTKENEDTIRAAADRWERIIVGDLDDVPVSSELPVCNLPVQVFVEKVDDLIVFVGFGAKLYAGHGGICGVRGGSKLPLTGINIYHPTITSGYGYKETALHEIGHALGLPEVWRKLGLLANSSSEGRVADKHFSGPLAIAAFDAAGGMNYMGAKVPVEEDGNHWRGSVLRGELMNPWGGSIPTRRFGQIAPISAITVQSFADLGYVVDINQADQYSLPRIAAKPAEASRIDVLSFDFSCHIPERPIAVVNNRGQVVHTIKGPTQTQDSSGAR